MCSNIKEQFLNGLLPGNYWITKSMEFSKVKTSGTLWYLKKWFVYYDFIFMKDTLTEDNYKEIQDIFKNFIESLDASVQAAAEKYFFEINNVDIRTNPFIKYSQFSVTGKTFENPNEKKEFYMSCKKFYFMYVMNLGGQGGYNEVIKDKINVGKTYEIILNEIYELLEAEDQISDFKQIISDYHASLRNDRKIFFYYGFFHGKESSELTGFYKVTKLGKAIIQSNFNEILIIWEHQKLKMISQSPATEFNKLVNTKRNPESFRISYSPYLTFLRIVKELGSISSKDYKYIVSRTNENYNIDDIINLLESDTTDEIEAVIKSFSRNSDVKNFDFGKEIKKYSLGIANMAKDKNTNYFSILHRNGLSIENKDRAEFLVKIYEYINDYLVKSYSALYKEFEKETIRKYTASYNNEDYLQEDIAVYKWHKYIINFDKTLLLNLLYIGIALKSNTFDFSINNSKIKESFTMYENYLLKVLGIKSKKNFSEIMMNVQNALIDYNQETGILKFEVENRDENEVLENIELPEVGEISEDRLKHISKAQSLDRKRNTNLITAVRKFYNQKYANMDDKLIKCDCCKETTFITDKDIAYLEFHHLIPFKQEDGPDHYLNLVALCPTCHRKMHHAKSRAKKELYDSISVSNNLRYSTERRLEQLYLENVLEPIHIEFLKNEEAITHEFYDKLMNNDTTSI